MARHYASNCFTSYLYPNNVHFHHPRKVFIFVWCVTWHKTTTLPTLLLPATSANSVQKLHGQKTSILTYIMGGKGLKNRIVKEFICHLCNYSNGAMVVTIVKYNLIVVVILSIQFLRIENSFFCETNYINTTAIHDLHFNQAEEERKPDVKTKRDEKHTFVF